MRKIRRFADRRSGRFTKACRWTVWKDAAPRVLLVLAPLGILAAACSSATVARPTRRRTVVAIGAAMTWSAPRSIDPNGNLASVSCTSASFCVAVGNSGDAFTYNGTSWSSPKVIDPNGILTSVSCPVARLCVVVNYAGSVVVGQAGQG